MAALLDTSAVLAAIDRADPAHADVVAALSAERATILLPIVVLPEVAFLLEHRHGAQRAAAAMDQIVRGSWPVISLESADLERATELMARYADARIGFVDAAIAALAERVAIVRIYTLDRRDFAILRPRHTPAFEIIPAGQPDPASARVEQGVREGWLTPGDGTESAEDRPVFPAVRSLQDVLDEDRGE